ncbi:unnamed protein product, partial [marine sediment metagenome]
VPVLIQLGKGAYLRAVLPNLPYLSIGLAKDAYPVNGYRDPKIGVRRPHVKPSESYKNG